VPPGGATDGGEGASAGGDGLLAVPGSGEADAASLDGVPQDVGPSGLVRVPVPDPRLRALWAAGGSPRQGQGLAARFTEGRPGPWGFSLFYVLLVGVFGFVVFRLWGALGGLEGRDADMPFPEDRGPDTLQRGDLGPTDPAKPAPRQIDSPERDA
jgi:hypothetical protein